MNTTGETTQPFYSHCDMNDPLCRAERLRIQFDYYRWHSLQPDDNDDVDTYTADIATRIGKTQRYVCDHLDAIYYLTQLPQLHALYQQLWHLDDTRLITITRIISALPTTYYDAIDTHLTRWLTPTQPAQTIPSTRAITRFLRKTITHLGFHLDNTRKPEQYVYIYDAGHGLAGIDALIHAGVAELLETTLRSIKKTHSCDDSTALQLLLEDKTSVVINLYDTGTGITYTPQGTALPQVPEHPVIRVLGDADVAVSTGYRFTEAMRRFIQGRDGVCRFPGCGVPAQWCDIDHVEEYDLGGVTGAVNAQCLCRHHHNVKTSRRVDCEIGAGGVVSWQIGDRRVVTTPEGVLAGQTFRQRREKKIKKAA